MKNKNYYFEPAEWIAENLYLYEFYGSPTKSTYEVNTHEYLNECGIIDKKLTTKINLIIHKNNYYRNEVHDLAYNSLAGLGGVNTSDVAVPKFIENYLNCEIKSSGNTYNFDTLLSIGFKYWTFEYKGLPYLIYSKHIGGDIRVNYNNPIVIALFQNSYGIDFIVPTVSDLEFYFDELEYNEVKDNFLTDFCKERLTNDINKLMLKDDYIMKKDTEKIMHYLGFSKDIDCEYTKNYYKTYYNIINNQRNIKILKERKGV